MKQPKAAFVSVLKPADDVRMFRKLALTFAQAGFQIHSLGYKYNPKVGENYPQTFFYEIFTKSRLHWSRCFVGFRLFWLLWQIRPQIIVCGAIEILPFCVFYKWFCRLTFGKILLVYDIQENYKANICFTETYPKFLRFFLANFICLVEKFCSLWIDKFFLAEQCYTYELSLPKNSYLILENKFLKSDLQKKKKEKNNCLRFLFAGTIAHEYGANQIPKVLEFLSEKKINFHLKILGKCSNTELYQKLQNIHRENVSVQISFFPVSYEKILNEYKITDVVLMPYQINEAYKNRIPTKFYEAMAHHTWIWVQENEIWRDFFKKMAYQKVIFSDFWTENINFENFTKNDFSTEIPFQNETIFWESEQQKIFVWLESLNFLQKSSKKS
jgi:glycosyltransferase involved in cell wall biosynthesis